MSSKSDITAKNARKRKFPELPEKYSSSRELRNKAEKLRRDRLNSLMEEMRTLVPIICNKKSKTDRTRVNILRLAANYLRVSEMFPTETTEHLLSANQSQNNILEDSVSHLESLDGFFFMLSEEEKILFISENIDKYIGYSQMELVGLSINEILHHADQEKLRSNIFSRNSSNSPHPLSIPNSPALETETKGPRRSFYLRLREKAQCRGEAAQYQHMHVVGHTATRGPNTVFVGVVRPVTDRPITELSLIEAIQDQYLTRHLPDGRIIYSDHRISTVSGYLPAEVTGKSAFNFFYAEDLPWTTMALRNMFASSSGEGTTVYRLFSRTGELICLQTRGFLEYNRSKNKIESFLCINTLIRPEDQDKYLQEQKEKFTPFITELQMDSKSSPEFECLEYDKSAESTTTKSNSTKVSVISKVCSKEGIQPPAGAGVPSPWEPEHSAASNWGQREQEQENAIKNSLLGKRKSFRDQEASFLFAKTSKAIEIQHNSVRYTPAHRVEDGVRIIDVDNLPPNLVETNSNTDENSFMTFEKLMDEIETSYSGPDCQTNCGMNQRSVIQKVVSPLPLVNKNLLAGDNGGEEQQRSSLYPCGDPGSVEAGANCLHGGPTYMDTELSRLVTTATVTAPGDLQTFIRGSGGQHSQ